MPVTEWLPRPIMIRPFRTGMIDAAFTMAGAASADTSPLSKVRLLIISDIAASFFHVLVEFFVGHDVQVGLIGRLRDVAVLDVHHQGLRHPHQQDRVYVVIGMPGLYRDLQAA